MAAGRMYLAAPAVRRRRVINRRRRALNPRQRREVKKIAQFNGEMKSIQTLFAPASITSAGSVTRLTYPAVGDTEATRDGNIITVKRLSFRLQIQQTAAQNNFVRCVIIKYKDEDSSGGIAAAALFTNAATSGAAMSPFDWNNAKYYTLIYDKQFAVAANGIASHTVHLELNRNDPVRFVTSGSTNGSNSYYVYLISDAAASTPVACWSARINYVDS